MLSNSICYLIIKYLVLENKNWYRTATIFHRLDIQTSQGHCNLLTYYINSSILPLYDIFIV
jgi:hypothetical protein